MTRVNIYTGYTRVYKVYSITRANMGTQDIYRYTGYAVLLGLTWVNRIYIGIQGIQYD